MSKAKRQEKNFSQYLRASINQLSSSKANKKIWRLEIESSEKMNKIYKKSNFTEDPFSFDSGENTVPKQKIKKIVSKNFLSKQKSSKENSTKKPEKESFTNLSERDLRALKRNKPSQQDENIKDVVVPDLKRTQKLLEVTEDYKNNSEKQNLIEIIKEFNEYPDLSSNEISFLCSSLIIFFGRDVDDESIDVVLNSVLLVISFNDAPPVDLSVLGRFSDLPAESNSIDVAIAVLRILQSFNYEEVFRKTLTEENTRLFIFKLTELANDLLENVVLGQVGQHDRVKRIYGIITVLDDFLSTKISTEIYSESKYSLIIDINRVMNDLVRIFLDSNYDDPTKEVYCIFYVGLLKLSVTLTSEDCLTITTVSESLDQSLMRIGLISAFSLPSLLPHHFEMELCVLGFSLLNNLVENLHMYNPLRILSLDYPGSPSADNLGELARVFERHAKHAMRMESELTDESRSEDSFIVRERRLSRAASRACSHMDESLISVYSALLIGCLIRVDPKIGERMVSLLGSSCFGTMVEMLVEFLEVINLTIYADDSTNKCVRDIIDFLHSFEVMD